MSHYGSIDRAKKMTTRNCDTVKVSRAYEDSDCSGPEMSVSEDKSFLHGVLERIEYLLKINADTQYYNQEIFDVVFGKDDPDCDSSSAELFPLADRISVGLSSLENQARDANALAMRLRRKLIGN